MSSKKPLESRLPRHSTYDGQFIKAKNLVELILKHQSPPCLQVIATEESYYTDHGIGHIERVISKLENLVNFLDEPINETETFVLLISAYFHDIGMFLGRKDEENPEQTRKQHHERSAEIIQSLNDRKFIDIDIAELGVIKKVIEAHRITDTQKFPETQRIAGNKVRTQLLGALLRIADACDCDRARAPRAIFEIFSQNIPESSKKYWQIHFPVTDVNFDKMRASIVVSIDLGEDLEGRIETIRMGNWLKKELSEELSSVSRIFLSNEIPLVRVEVKEFSSGQFIEFSQFPEHENYLMITVGSYFDKTGELMSKIAGSISDMSCGIRLIIEIRPPEGPLFIDTKTNIDVNEFEKVRTELMDDRELRMSLDIRETPGKVTLRSGVVS